VSIKRKPYFLPSAKICYFGIINSGLALTLPLLLYPAKNQQSGA
jgi:hypothetical protein